MAENPIIWQPALERERASMMHGFMVQLGFDNYEDLYRWSVEAPAAFWEALCDFCDVCFLEHADKTLSAPNDIMNAGWFAGSTLNYAQHQLRFTGRRTAIVFCGEDGTRRELCFDELHVGVAEFAAGLRRAGVGKGDRVAGFLPNCPEAIMAMLAAASIGATWSSCSPDFGVNGVVDRFGQIEPKVLVAGNGYYYNGKRFDSLSVVADVVAAIPGIEHTVIVPFAAGETDPTRVTHGISWRDFVVRGEPLEFLPVEFDHPLFIMFSSGTTGVPKCIVHGHGGTLLQHLKEHVLHTDLGPDDTLFYFTTCGWMMWNWLASGLATGAKLVLFDGTPFFDEGHGLWKMAEREGVTVFGTSAKYISALEKAGVRPKDHYQLSSLRAILSTGSPLAAESFDFVYDAIAEDVQLSSIAGGTDIISCFVLGNPMLPVRRGEIQCRGLGMAVEIWNEEGVPVVGENGELVCTRPFPSAPVGFWDDPGDTRYKSAYFERFGGVWAHGDFAELTPEGGIVIHGRSDSVLNPGGVRIGTAEIYRQVERLDEVVESIVVGQRWDGDVRVVLFVVLQPGVELDDDLCQRIRSEIRSNTTPRHVPAKIVAVPDIPRTKSGKIVELAVRSVVHGEEVKNTDALANPEALQHYRDLEELARD